MSKLPETKVGILSELHAWESIIHSNEWLVYKKLLSEHCEYLQKEVNTLLENQKFTEAYGKLIAMKDSKSISELVRIRIAELNKQSEKGA